MCDVLSDLVPFVQFKKRDKHTWRNVTFNKVADWESATLLKVTLLPGCFSPFLNYTNGTKSRNVSHMNFSSLILFHYLKRVKGEFYGY